MEPQAGLVLHPPWGSGGDALYLHWPIRSGESHGLLSI